MQKQYDVFIYLDQNRRDTFIMISWHETLSALQALFEGKPPVTGNTGLWCFLCYQPEQADEHTVKQPVTWEAIWCHDLFGPKWWRHIHDDFMIWQHFLHYRPFVKGIHQSLVDSLHKGPVIQGFDVSFVISLSKLMNIQSSSQWFEEQYDVFIYLDQNGGDTFMMISWHGNTFCITGSLWRESTSHWWIPFTKGQLCRALVFPLLPAWASWWTYSQAASDLRCHGTHVMSL